jgi:hypothetical protein
MGSEIQGKITLKIQGFSVQKAPEKCFGHFASGSRACLACKHDRECRVALGARMRMTIEIRRAPAREADAL